MIRHGKALLLGALLVSLAISAFAAPALPPLPRPRPDHDSQPQPPATAPGQETDQQALIRKGFPAGEDSDALMPPDAPAGPVSTKPEPVTLTATITEKGARIADGLTWRIFSTKPDKDGKLAMVARSDKAAPVVTLPPGDYVVHVAYGEAQTSDTLTVAGKPANMAMVLDAGGLKLNALVSGDMPIPTTLLHFDIFTAGASDADRALVAEKVGPNDIVTLNAGTYHVVSYFGDANATVRADLRVEPAN